MRAHTIHRPMRRQRAIIRICIALSAFVLVLAACGQSPASGEPTATASTTLTGCPESTQTVTWPSAPAVVITPPFSTTPTTIHAGQTLEAVFPFYQLWRFTSGSEQPALTLDTPAGYGDSGAGRCIWHFTAHQAGRIDLAFTMQALCPPGTNCPLYIAILKAPILVIMA